MNKLLLVGINSKYIHPNMAIRILKNDLVSNKIDCDLLESNIKENMDTIIETIKAYDIVCFSVYIFNVSYIKELIIKLRSVSPHQVIILGGPEVSYYNESNLNDLDYDYIICGEGEHALVELLNHLDDPSQLDYVIDKKNRIMNKDLNKVDVSYAQDLANDYSNIDLNNQIAYLETSRGCPYLCSYCQASLDNDIRLFDLDYVKDKLDYLITNNAKMVKLLDRTFNFKVQRTNEIIQYIIDHDNQYTTFQLEITGELLDSSTIDLINTQARAGLFRFEIGIQSTNQASNQAVRRYQNFDKLAAIIKRIQEGNKVIFHLDLIAGLPFEDLESFHKTFDDVFALYPDELQLGFLKLLKGTYLNITASQYLYVFDKEAPYEIIESQWLSKDDLEIISKVEFALNNYYNKDKTGGFIKYYLQNNEISPFSLFSILSKHIYHGIDVYNLFVNMVKTLQLTFDEKIVLFKSYYSRSNNKVQSLYKVESKRELLHLLSRQDNQSTRNVFKYACVDKLDNDNYFIYKVDDKSCYLANMKDGYINEI